MPLVDRQRKMVEVGRIRIGQRVQMENGKSRPARLETLRFTSPDQLKIHALAERYGGESRPWQAPTGAAAWEVVTKATVIPVRIPPGEPVSQFYERWAGRSCDRRCDGAREQFSGKGCLCPSDLAERKLAAAADPPQACKPTTRLSLILADIPGLGVWVLTSRGDSAADELAGVAELLHNAAVAGHILPASLRLDVREVRNAQSAHPKRFVVPVLDVGASLAELQAGIVPQPVLEQPPKRVAIEAPVSQSVPQSRSGNGTPPDVPPGDSDVIDAEVIESPGQIQAAQAVADKLLGMPAGQIRQAWDQADRAGLLDVSVFAPDGDRMPLRGVFHGSSR